MYLLAGRGGDYGLGLGDEMNTQTLFSSRSCDYTTPQAVFDALHREFRFDLDPCAPEGLNRGIDMITYRDPVNGLTLSWAGRRVFLNPPYGATIGRWLEKAYWSATTEHALVVCLLPSRTDTKWWHEYVMQGEIRFIRGRLTFGQAKHPAPFPSAIVVFPRHR